jgi:hypothetical protein
VTTRQLTKRHLANLAPSVIEFVSQRLHSDPRLCSWEAMGERDWPTFEPTFVLAILLSTLVETTALGAGCKILGGVLLGNGIVVGANAVVLN